MWCMFVKVAKGRLVDWNIQGFESGPLRIFLFLVWFLLLIVFFLDPTLLAFGCTVILFRFLLHRSGVSVLCVALRRLRLAKHVGLFR